MELLYVLIWEVIWGAICQAVGKQKNINGFWWGFFLGIIGLIVVLCTKEKKDINEINVTTNNSNETQTDKYEQLEKLSKLKESGAISEEEFESEKKKLLK